MGSTLAQDPPDLMVKPRFKGQCHFGGKGGEMFQWVGALAKRLFCILLNEAPWPTQAPTAPPADLIRQVDVMREVDSQKQ